MSFLQRKKRGGLSASSSLLRAFTIAAAVCVWSYAARAQKLELPSELGTLTSSNAAGYIKPLLTTISESLHSNLAGNARHEDAFSIGLNISAQAMIIPASQKTFDAELPASYAAARVAELRAGQITRGTQGSSPQPTIYGGAATPVYAASPSDATVKTLGFVEGGNMDMILGVPNVQLMVNLPTRTQLRLRLIPANVSGRSLLYYCVGLSQRLDRALNMFGDDADAAFAAYGAYQAFSAQDVATLTLMTAGANASKSFGKLTLYAALQYEATTGSFEATRKASAESASSPYAEIRLLQPLKFDLQTFNSFRVFGGLAYRLGFLELNLDAGYAAQPVVSGGLSFWFF